MDFPHKAIAVPFTELIQSEIFAEQLKVLNETTFEKAMAKTRKAGHKVHEYRDAIDPMFVSDWLLSALADRKSNVAPVQDFPIISKKIRDDVVYNGNLLPFKRSGLWTTIRVLLMINLRTVFDERLAKFLYKSILLRAMTKVCKLWLREDVEMKSDVAIQMIAKISRRLEKIIVFYETCSDVLESRFGVLFTSLQEQVKNTIRKVRAKMNDQFDELNKKDQNEAQFSPLKDLNFDQDIRQTLPTLKKYIDARENTIESVTAYILVEPHVKPRHRVNVTTFPDQELLSTVDELEAGLILSDFENWIFHYLDRSNSSHVMALRQLMFTYGKKAKKYYDGDALGGSRMILALLKIIQILDKIAIQKHPLLKEHHSGINNIVQELILPTNMYMKLALDMEVYFAQRNSVGSYPGLLQEDQVSQQSFSARYASQNPSMISVKQAILAMGERKIAEKKAEVLAARNEVKGWRQEAALLSCTYYTSTDRWGRKTVKHSSDCRLCQLEGLIRNKRVSLYERPLRNESYNQDGVVFELIIPDEVVCLRDVLHFFITDFCLSMLSSSKLDKQGKWIDYVQISNHTKNTQERVHLSSTTKLFLNTHFNKPKHPDEPLDDFIVNNGYNCIFEGRIKPIEKHTVKKYCTFEVHPHSIYSGMQWMVSTTVHHQNQVLASQSACDKNLSLSEYVAFGSLRSDGHRLQIRNIYRTLGAEALSFETESVVSLILQAIWEAGPNDLRRWHREAHEDFSSIEFTCKMIELLTGYAALQEKNWKHPLRLLVVILITVRILEMNDSYAVVERGVKLLLDCRRISIEWISKVEAAKSNCDSSLAEEIEKYRQIVVDSSICCALTFSLNTNVVCFSKIWQAVEIESVEENKQSKKSVSAVQAWLFSIVSINSNIILSQAGLSEMSQLKLNMLRFVRIIGVRLEKIVLDSVRNNRNDVNDFATEQWGGAKGGSFDEWKSFERVQQVIYVKVTALDGLDHYIEIDVILGKFLVDGLPISGLPDEITSHKLFQRLFGPTRNFEVQPTENRTFCTKFMYNSCHFFFQMLNSNLIIKEQQSDGKLFELIPHSSLSKEVPNILETCYSHWWTRSEHRVDFRCKQFNSKNFWYRKNVAYELHLKSSLLIEIKTGRNMVDVRSESFKKIVQFTNRLEARQYIHILMDDQKMVSVELPRMRIKFKIDESNELVSHEYRGMRVSLQQKFATFVGLRHGLLLDKHEGHKKVIIVPHGKILIDKGNSGHTAVSISVSGLFDPPFFVYELDDKIQQLKARNSQSAWFFMAHLHAVTSHPLPDQFTGMTGTERALQILQSAFSWSPEPYDKHSIRSLKNIAKLSPKRSFYPKHIRSMSCVEWPPHLHSSSAHDGYCIVVQKILADSNRMEFLHSKTNSSASDDETLENEKSYRRHMNYCPNAKIDKCIIDVTINTATSHHKNQVTDDMLLDMRILSTLEHEMLSHIPQNVLSTIRGLLISNSDLNGEIEQISCQSPLLQYGIISTLRDIWIDFYNVARKKLFDVQKRILLFSLLSFNGASRQNLLILQTIARNASEFAELDPPPVSVFVEPKRDDFERSTIESIFKKHETGAQKYLEDNEYQLQQCGDDNDRCKLRRKLEEEYKSILKQQVDSLIRPIEASWPRWPFRDISKNSLPSSSLVVTSAAIKEINILMLMWNQNRQLKIFLQKVAKRIESLPSTELPSPLEWKHSLVPSLNWSKFEIEFQDKTTRQFKDSSLKRKRSSHFQQAKRIFDRQEDYAKETLSVWWKRFIDYSLPFSEHFLMEAGLYPRLVPSLILPKILTSVVDAQKCFIVVVGMLFSVELRAGRIAIFRDQLPQMEVALRREEESQPFENWSPADYPEWLLFEIEMNVTIRRIQIQVAKRMINPPGGAHSVMQLNMGEGKTAVIVPILASRLSNEQHVCQVTVLKSLFHSNLRSLRQCLGGMLNQRVYTFPCRRDMTIGQTEASIMLMCYKECKEKLGIVMTLPEYRCSFQLKMYETAKRGHTSASAVIMETHKWLNANIRNILDESDAILHAKYQLIYTVGEQLPPGGGELRWTVIQELLKLIPRHLMLLWQKYGNEKIEFDEKYQSGPEIFTPCRILDSSVYEELKEAIASDFVEGKTFIQFPELKSDEKKLMKQIITDKAFDSSQLYDDIKSSGGNASARNTVLLLSGLLKYEVLHLVLRRRWRVNYGVNPRGHRKMAVPFIAKDVCAQNTEFGHLDVAIAFTHLSYYYSGLTDAQLYQSFRKLDQNPKKEEIYKRWVQQIDKHKVHSSIQTYSGVNLSDSLQREKFLFPVLRQNMYVIDFWLSNCVFPKEAKLFAGKMMCTAWDLCSEEFRFSVNGFSGTNDTKLLLPKPISQNDLEELEDTNENVRRTLLLDENDYYDHLPPNVSGLDIIKGLLEHKIPVLLDSGALMLELNNHQVAKKWLKLAPQGEVDAGVYFNERDILMVIDRYNIETEFYLSPFRERLDRCVVYLDDVHTRGTDLKFPRGTSACVTVAGHQTRDKTVQACMRMRLLGQGHTIRFWASEEADNDIRKLCDKSKTDVITTDNVLKFICHNSRSFEKDGLVHWAAAGYNYSQKLAAYRHTNSLEELSKRCTDQEPIELDEIYGEKNEMLFTEIIENRFLGLTSSYKDSPNQKWLNDNANFIKVKLSEHIPDLTRFSQLIDEEQEKELEHELEEQREVYRPGAVVPAQPVIDEKLRRFLQNGLAGRDYFKSLLGGSVLELPLALYNTSIWPIVQEKAWGEKAFITRDFLTVIQSGQGKVDEFLRPVWWLVSAPSKDKAEVVLLLSPFEINHFMPIFRENCATTLHMYSPRVSPEQNNLKNVRQLQLPIRTTAIQIKGMIEAQLSAFSGNIYFANRNEQRIYCNFLGIIPRPRSYEHQQAFENRHILLNGFVRPEHRTISAEIQKNCRFENNPEDLIRKIVDRRHGFLPRMSHVALIVIEGNATNIMYDGDSIDEGLF